MTVEAGRNACSAVEHELLDMLDANRGHLSMLGGHHLVETASKDAAAALRANPDTGMGIRRREKALSAAVRLILAVEQMDAGQ
jgi:hypothetical protein